MGKGKMQQFGVNQGNQKWGEAAGDEQSSTEHPRAVPIRPPEGPAVLRGWREGENCRKWGLPLSEPLPPRIHKWALFFQTCWQQASNHMLRYEEDALSEGNLLC